ncbi:MAG: Na+/H+ antiporter NhaC [Bacteroidaceae bacterium]|nr:Na+/H+ antiporter NhaC [Bacteroidaceae bacterium]
MKEYPPLWVACVPLVLLVALIACVVSVFGDDALSGASQIALILATAVCVGIGLLTRRITWDDFEKAIAEKVSGVSQALFILLLIGALGGSWMLSGVVPTLIYYGMEIMHPQWFLASACIISSVVSVMTGSSWTTIATIGIALMGIGQALGYEEGWIAGAVISGAYFGDKISPLSDTTVLASSTVGVPLFTHIRYMMYTTVPTMLVTLLIFTVRGLMQPQADVEQIAMVQEALDRTFLLSPWLLLVPVLTFIMILRKRPAMAVLFTAVLMGIGVAVCVQGELLDYIAGEEFEGIARRFRGAMILMYGSTGIETGAPELDELVATRGMSGMLGTIWLILCATIFGAAMTATRMVDSIMHAIIRMIRGTASMVAGTAFTGIFLNIVSADQYLSIILTSNIFQSVYKDNGYENRLLSRTCEDSATVTSVLIPWNTCGMTQSSVLGVTTLAYAPYAIFCYLSPVMTVLMAFLGYKIVRTKR